MGNHTRKRTFYTDEETAMIVGGYRLTDGYERDYATRLGIEAALLSHLKKRAVRDGLRQKFPEHFGDTTTTGQELKPTYPGPIPEIRYVSDVADQRKIAQLEGEVDTMKATNVRLANQLEKAKRRLGKAVSLLLDDE